ncbi:hypothetical protein QJS04_geneDACA000281 [Acorus gramineus]|uniref:Uncharacterized protein n=1 Tax=Acorus gramineus TaxID=55184 RepID=A0AAV9AR03_ACOGR|nr:hypothetical protein QJS04_geneDACA000281 [Acorus gramineus]
MEAVEEVVVAAERVAVTGPDMGPEVVLDMVPGLEMEVVTEAVEEVAVEGDKVVVVEAGVAPDMVRVAALDPGPAVEMAVVMVAVVVEAAVADRAAEAALGLDPDTDPGTVAVEDTVVTLEKGSCGSELLLLSESSG